jgi:hypothetical protein
MPPRRGDKKTPDPSEEREMTEERGMQVSNLAMKREMHNIHTRVMDVEIKQR